jgi:hypothetical protein
MLEAGERPRYSLESHLPRMHLWMEYMNDETACSIRDKKGQGRQEISSESKKRGSKDNFTRYRRGSR